MTNEQPKLRAAQQWGVLIKSSRGQISHVRAIHTKGPKGTPIVSVGLGSRTAP